MTDVQVKRRRRHMILAYLFAIAFLIALGRFIRPVL
jgi:hypothetical protein